MATAVLIIIQAINISAKNKENIQRIAFNKDKLFIGKAMEKI